MATIYEHKDHETELFVENSVTSVKIGVDNNQTKSGAYIRLRYDQVSKLVDELQKWLHSF
jgi:hypothetical protein